MKPLVQIVAGGLLTAFLVGCATASPAAPTLAPTATVSPAAQGIVTASVKVVPAQQADLAFVVSGPVQDVQVKEGQAVQAGQSLITLDVPDLSFAEVAAQAALKAAQENAFIQSQGRKKWNGTKFLYVSGPPEQLQAYNDMVDQAQAALIVAQAQLAQATLTAPFNGTVTSVTVSPGEMVQAQQVVLTIGGLDHLQIETTDLSERFIANMHVGDAATVRLKAFTAPLNGRVTAIAPLAGKSTDGDTIFKVTIELDQQPAGLMWGMTGDVEIKTQ